MQSVFAMYCFIESICEVYQIYDAGLCIQSVLVAECLICTVAGYPLAFSAATGTAKPAAQQINKHDRQALLSMPATEYTAQSVRAT